MVVKVSGLFDSEHEINTDSLGPSQYLVNSSAIPQVRLMKIRQQITFVVSDMVC